MPTFTKPEQIATVEAHKPKLTAALKAVTAEGTNFLYYPKHLFGKNTGALLVVDYDANLPKDATFQKLVLKEPLAAKGTVSLMPDNKLKFVGPEGTCLKKAICEEIQKGILILGHQVFIPAEDEVAPKGPSNFQQAKPGAAADPTKRVLSPSTREATAPKAVAPKPAVAQTAAPKTPAPTGTTASAKPKVEVAAQRTPIRPPGVSPDAPTATIEGMRKGGALVTRIRKLAESPWPPALEFYKAAHVQEIERLVRENKLTQATMTVDRLAVQILPKDAQKFTNLPGVDDFFLNPEDRFEAGVKVGESSKALELLIAHRISSLPPDQQTAAQAQWQGTMNNLVRGLGNFNEANEMARKAESGEDPDGRAAMIKAFNLHTQKIADRAESAKKARDLWYPAMKHRLEKSKNPKAEKMIEVLGEEQFLEMAQFAEVFCAQQKVNPFIDAKANQGKVLTPMDLSEVAAIYGYSTQDFTVLNGVLRNPNADAAKTAKYQPYIDACKSALQKLPVFKGEATRSDKTLHSSVVETLLASGEFKPSAFVSAGTRGKVPGFGGILSVMKNIKTGREITMFSLHMTEGEVLFPPGSVFKLISAELPGQAQPITNYQNLAGILNDKIPAAILTFEQVS